MTTPPWIVALLARAQRDRLTGFLTLSFRHGDIRHAKVEQVYFPPGDGTLACPRGCGPMVTKDQGALHVCEACGAKRTAAQVAQAGRAVES